MPMRRGRVSHSYGRLQSWEVWVRDKYDGMVSEQSRVFDDADKADAYKREVVKRGDYDVSIRPSNDPIRLGKSEASLREDGRWKP